MTHPESMYPSQLAKSCIFFIFSIPWQCVTLQRLKKNEDVRIVWTSLKIKKKKKKERNHPSILDINSSYSGNCPSPLVNLYFLLLEEVEARELASPLLGLDPLRPCCLQRRGKLSGFWFLSKINLVLYPKRDLNVDTVWIFDLI